MGLKDFCSEEYKKDRGYPRESPSLGYLLVPSQISWHASPKIIVDHDARTVYKCKIDVQRFQLGKQQNTKQLIFL